MITLTLVNHKKRKRQPSRQPDNLGRENSRDNLRGNLRDCKGKLEIDPRDNLGLMNNPRGPAEIAASAR